MHHLRVEHFDFRPRQVIQVCRIVLQNILPCQTAQNNEKTANIGARDAKRASRDASATFS